MQKVLIVGGVAGGASAAARLRRLDEHAEIVLFERGEYISFANCGLPYYIGGEITDREELTLQTPQGFRARFNVDVRVKNEVVAIDRARKSVTVKNHATAETYEETYDKLVLAPGAEPVRLPVPGAGLDRVFTLRNIPDTYRIRDFIDAQKPRRAVVVGGGAIGLEMAENLARAGLAVTIVEMLGQVLPPMDYEMARGIERHLAENGVRVLLRNGVAEIRESADGLAVLLDEGEADLLETDMVLFSAGVRPESGLAKEAGLAVSERGCIMVNEHMQTGDPDIYAVGDAAEATDFLTAQKGFVPLAGPANKQGRVAADHICGLPAVYRGTQGSSILRVFEMTAASTGLSEKIARRLGLNYDKVYLFPASHAGYYPGATTMMMKVLYDTGSGKILGAQLAGRDGVDKRCDVLATAIRAGLTAGGLAELELCYAPPYSSAKDPVNMAGFLIEDLLAGLVKQFHWHDVAALPRDGSATLLDVRTEAEFARGAIDGFINIPLDSLRRRLGELDKAKPVYVTCQVGFRGYMAARILSQNGFDAQNLSGGYRLYRSTLEA